MKKPLKILIVEDSEGDAKLLIHELMEGGYDPTYRRVDNRAGMQEALDREKWDLVVADHFMPQFDSAAALALLKERGLDLPFLIVSGMISEDAAVAAMKAGAHDYVLKGNLKRLVPAVDRELREAAERGRRRKAEEVLQESERHFRSLIENTTRELQARVQQQAVVADIGHLALSGTHPALLMNDVVSLLAQTLKADFGLFLELLPGGTTLLLRAGYGWREGSLGRTEASFPFLSEETIVFEDLQKEGRFRSPSLLQDHGVVSGMSVLIRGQDQPFGVLGIYTRKPKTFTQDDVNFVQAVANIVAAAIDRKNLEAEKLLFSPGKKGL